MKRSICQECGDSFNQEKSTVTKHSDTDTVCHTRVPCGKCQGSSPQTSADINNCSQRDNTSDLTSPSEEHDSSVTERHICCICQEEFHDEVSLIEHYDSHQHDNASELTSLSEEHDSSVNEIHNCWICQEEFNDMVSLIEHCNNHMQSTE